MAKIVLSYRRDDSGTITNWLTEKLVDRYGREAIFRDIDSIQPTENFRKRIGRALRDCDFVVAIVGPGWVGKDADGKSRINAPNDWVRVEVETALQLDIPLLPVLVEGAEMPQPDELPASLREMTEINALPISSSGARFYDDLARLYAAIEKVTGAAPAGDAQAPPEPVQEAVAEPTPQPIPAAPVPVAEPAAEAAPPAAAPVPAGQASGRQSGQQAVRPVAERRYALLDWRTLLLFVVFPSLAMAAFWVFAFLTKAFNGDGSPIFLLSALFMMGLGRMMQVKGRMRAIDAVIVGTVVGLVTLLASLPTGGIDLREELVIAFFVFVAGGIATTFAGFFLGRFIKTK